MFTPNVFFGYTMYRSTTNSVIKCVGKIRSHLKVDPFFGQYISS